MVWWVDLFDYTPPVLSDSAAACEHIAGADLPDSSAQALMAAVPTETLDEIQRELQASAWSWADLMRIKNRAVELLWDGFATVSNNQFAIDVRNFFRDKPALRTDSQERLKAAIEQQRAAGHDVMVIAHSFGAIVAYETIRELPSRAVHTLVTIGGPLAWCYDIWDQAAPPANVNYLAAKEFPSLGLRHWWNIYDPADPVVTAKVVAVAPQIAPEFLATGNPVVVDAPISNTYTRAGDLGSPHDYRGYLTSEAAQRAIRLFMLETE
jgi:pimeloyl-ACP methyl ester carboxylesterase